MSVESIPPMPEPAAFLLLPSEVWNVRAHLETYPHLPCKFPVSEGIMPHTVPVSDSRSAYYDTSTLFPEMKLTATPYGGRWNVYSAAHLAAVVAAREFFKEPSIVYEVCDLPLDFAADAGIAGQYIVDFKIRESGVGYASKSSLPLQQSMRDFLGAISFSARGVDVGSPGFTDSVELLASRCEDAHQTDFFVAADVIDDRIAVVASRQDTDRSTTSFSGSSVAVDDVENVLGKDLMSPQRTQTSTSFDVCLKGLLDKPAIANVSQLVGKAVFLRAIALD